jgi:hypothetical protein
MKIRPYALLTASLLFAFSASAAEFQCEVLNLMGRVTVIDKDGSSVELKEGDLVSKGQTVKADAGAALDLAFDGQWKNVARLESGSELSVESVHPAKLKLKNGAVFAKLKALPKGSAFEVNTPTATATVRGTEYRTVFSGGQTKVFNVSPLATSTVAVASVLADGSAGKEVVLAPSTKTEVASGVDAPKPATVMSADETQATKAIQAGIEEGIQEAVAEGRQPKIQSVEDLEKAKTEAVTDEYSRVNDTRRRAFKGGAGA